jgi:GNAT superfamily N-acetyltransferase
MAKIRPLKEVPDYAPIFAFWAFREWYSARSVDFNLIIRAYKDRINDTNLPVTWAAIEDNIPVGMASLKLNDLWSRKDLNPWLSSLFVLPEYRCRGIGSLLINSVIEKAKTLDHKILYLFADKKKSELGRYYINRGWIFLDKTIGNDNNIIEIYSYGL